MISRYPDSRSSSSSEKLDLSPAVLISEELVEVKLFSIDDYPVDVSDAAAQMDREKSNKEWRDIWMSAFESDSDANIFQHPDFVIAQSEGFKNKPLLMVVAEASDGRRKLAILAPIEVPQKCFFDFIPVSIFNGYRLAGNRFLGESVENDPLDSYILGEFTNILQRYTADFMLIEDLEENHSLWEACKYNLPRDLFFFLPEHTQKKHRIKLPKDANEYSSSLSSSAHREFRRKHKRSKGVRIQKCTKASEVDDFLIYANQISANSWQSKVFGLRVKNDDAERTLLKTVANLGYLRCYLMFSNDIPIAFEIAYQLRGYVYGAEAGYDQNYSNISPGYLLLYLEIEDLVSDDELKWYDFGKGDAPFKERFSNVATKSADVWVIRHSKKNALRIAIFKANEKIERFLHVCLEKSGLKTRIRQLYRKFSVN